MTACSTRHISPRLFDTSGRIHCGWPTCFRPRAVFRDFTGFPGPPEALFLVFDELAQRLEIPGHRSAVAREILVARS